MDRVPATLPVVLTRSVFAAGALVLLGATPALAHVEVEAAPARALATDVTLTMHAEAESTSAGVTGVRIQLPAGLVPADLTLATGPVGWRLTGSGPVATVRGPALPVGRDLELVLRVRQLPAGDQLVLKTVQSYADGDEDAWIEVPSASVPEPDHPAPVVRLAAAAAGATPVPRGTTPAATTAAPTTAAPTVTATTAAPVAEATGTEPAGSESGSLVGWLFGGVAVGVVLLGVVVLASRRGTPRP